jgi:tetratricopeptide (TPR) repeat protein
MGDEMKQWKKINSILFIVILLSIGVYNIFNFDKSLLIPSENRALASWPEFEKKNYFSGDFARGVDNYIQDRFVFRRAWLEMATSLSHLRGIKEKEDFILLTTTGANEGEAVAKDTEEETGFKAVHDVENFPDDVGMLKVVKPVKGVEVTKIEFAENFKTNILIYDQKGMTSYVFKSNLVDRLAKAYNAVESTYEDALKIYALTAPSPVAFVNEEYARYTDNQYDGIQDFYEKLDRNIIKIDPYPILAEHQDEYIYFKTDHHWTSLGAYYGYVEACRKMDLQPKPVSEFDQLPLIDFLGSIYNLTKSDLLKDNYDEIYAYIPRADIEYKIVTPKGELVYDQVVSTDFYITDYKYNVFLGGDYNLAFIENHDPTLSEETLMVVKDSYGNALIPYFVNHFKRIIIVDPRYNQRTVSDLVAEYQVSRLMFVNSGQALASESYVDLLENLN